MLNVINFINFFHFIKHTLKFDFCSLAEEEEEVGEEEELPKGGSLEIEPAASGNII